MTIRILVNGAAGRMGQEVVKAVNADHELQLVGQTDKNDDLAASIKKSQAQIVIDFTNPEVVYENALSIIESGAHPVIGTTGMDLQHIRKLQQRCEELKRGGIIAPNFSIGAVLMMKFAQTAAQYFPAVEIIELHHAGKADSPSGTAIKTAEMIATHLKAQELQTQKETIPHARGATLHNIPIHSVRLPGLVAHQMVIFGEQAETLTLRHDSIHREAFMPGVILACKKVMALDHMIYGLEHLL